MVKTAKKPPFRKQKGEEKDCGDKDMNGAWQFFNCHNQYTTLYNNCQMFF